MEKVWIPYKLFTAAAVGYYKLIKIGVSWDVTPCSLVGNRELYSYDRRRNFYLITGLTDIILLTQD
jgi:hypothetical protein